MEIEIKEIEARDEDMFSYSEYDGDGIYLFRHKPAPGEKIKKNRHLVFVLDGRVLFATMCPFDDMMNRILKSAEGASS